MDTLGVMGTTIAFLTMAGGLIAIYTKGREEAALLRQKQGYMQCQIDKLELRVSEIEETAIIKMDKLSEMINVIRMDISKLLNK